jgi:hypothetical protein
MREINKIAEGLFEKIRDRFEDVSLGNDNAKATTDPEKARFFNFDYVVDDTNHGNITMSLIDETSLKVYFSKNISSDLDDEQKKEWYSFLRELREFARRNLLSFEPRDITRSTLKHRDIQQQSKADSTYDADEVVAESRMYGTLNRSYESFGPVRIKLQHTKPIMDETHGARSRNIAAVFVENDQGERFRLPFENLTGARAMARHVSAGGVPTDDLGRHITEMVGEMTTLRPFVRGMARRTFEDAVTKEMVESAFGYHALLKNTLKKLKGKRGYTEFKESFKPALVEDDANVAELKELFVKKTLDERIEQALPLVHKAYNIMKENNNPYAQQFENWADKLSEGSWALPDTDDDVEQLIDWMSEEHPVGVDAQDATNSLYNIIGDDRLFDRLQELADIDPTADARDVVSSWLYDNLPQVYQRIESEMGDPDMPAEPSEDNQEVDESYTPPPVMINGKQVDLGSIELDGVESYDRPDYADAYASAATFTDGTALTDDELDELSDKHGDIINMRAHDMLEDKEYGQAIPGSTENMLATTNENEEDQLANIEDIQSAIIRRILNSINDHSELLKKAGPEGIMNAASDVASFHAPMEEIGSSDISIMVREVYREVGVDYPEEVNEDKEECKYCGGDCPNDEEHACDGYLGDIDDLYKVTEAKDKVTYDPKTGKLTGWEHEGDWKKSKGKKKDPIGKIHNLSDKARRETEKMSEDETLEEAFERALNEAAINVGDMIRDKTQPEIQGKVVGDQDENYIIKVEGEHYHILKLNAEVVKKGLLEADSRFMSFLEPLVGKEVYIPGEGTTGTVVGPSPNPKLPTGIQVKLSNGQLVTTGPGLFKASKPGLVQQAIDKLNSLTGKIDPVPSVAKPYGSVAGPMDNLHKQDWSSVKEDILKLAGVR